MPVYKWDSAEKKMVKISDRSYRTAYSDSGKSLSEQVMEGYRRVEARGERINGTPEKIKRIWEN